MFFYRCSCSAFLLALEKTMTFFYPLYSQPLARVQAPSGSSLSFVTFKGHTFLMELVVSLR